MARPRSRATATEAQLRAWVEAGESAAQIAERLGRSDTCVAHGLQLLGLGNSGPGKPKLSDAQLRSYVRLIQSGWTLAEIGQRFGVSAKAVYVALRRHGLPGAQQLRGVLPVSAGAVRPQTQFAVPRPAPAGWQPNTAPFSSSLPVSEGADSALGP